MATTALTRTQVRQLAIISVAAVAIFAFLRWLPTGTNLSHMDFRRSDGNSIDFCDPLNPQFIPVVAVASPVTLTLRTDSPEPAEPNRETRFTLHMVTASGKPIAPEDLLVTHTEKLHLLIVDPFLVDYQHIHPVPGHRAGDWTFAFTPKRSGRYRVFADFTPAATSRGLYASTEVVVGSDTAGTAPARALSWTANRDGYHFALTPGAEPLRARQPTDLFFSITRADGGEVPLEPVMGAFAHLVAFDENRSGFAHLHPMETDLLKRPDATHPKLSFKITIPSAGRYVIWAQINLSGRETFVPFWFDVVK